MQHHLYPADWRSRAQACLERAGYRCQDCGMRHGTMRVGRHRYNLYIVHLHAAHVNHDPYNPQAELRALCPACHMRYDRRNEQAVLGHHLPRRRGYQPITLERVLSAARSGGLAIIPVNGGASYCWSIGDLAGSAPDVLEAIGQALHCLCMERLEPAQEGGRHG
jgi:DNA-binding transcriptional LysR family regulator